MLVALVVALLLWTYPAPQLWVCNPGHDPTGAPSNCYRVHYSTLGKWPFSSVR